MAGYYTDDFLQNDEHVEAAQAKRVMLVSSTGSSLAPTAGGIPTNIVSSTGSVLTSVAGVQVIPMEFLSVTYHPWGKGDLTSNGAQYTVATTGAAEDTITSIGNATITIPTGATIIEVEYGLTAAVIEKDGETINLYYRIGNTSTGYDTMATTATTGTTYQDITYSGRYPTTGVNYTGTNPFVVDIAIKSTSTGTTGNGGKIKNSSYVTVIYKLW
jgi:hypothetical protein